MSGRSSRGRLVNVWYRYPSEAVPRSIARVRILHPHTSVTHAVSRAIARDFGWHEVLQELHDPTSALLRRMNEEPSSKELAREICHALQYASLQPSPYLPDRPFERRPKRRRPEEEKKEKERVQKRQRVQ